MLKWILRIVIALAVIVAALFWWLMLSGAKAPASAPGVIDMAAVRTLAEAPAETRPTALKLIELGYDDAPNFAIQAGRLSGTSQLSYNAVVLEAPDALIVVGGGADAETAREMEQTETAVFDPVAYESLLDALTRADVTVMTHEHLDHVMAIARHPVLSQIAPALRLNQPQIDMMGRFMNEDQTAAWDAQNITARLDGTLQAIAPGVVIIPAAGHTAGSQMVFISMASGQEVLLIGDIAWNMMNIEALTTRPILTQYVMFDPNEVRTSVRAQLRALHDLAIAEPDIAIVPAHDRAHLQELGAAGVLEFFPAEEY